jgi:hypothetical protein
MFVKQSLKSLATFGLAARWGDRWRGRMLYGTTEYGGSGGYGYGLLAHPPATAGAPWTEAILYAFSGKDGISPLTNLWLSERTGALFGTTYEGGHLGKSRAYPAKVRRSSLARPHRRGVFGSSRNCISYGHRDRQRCPPTAPPPPDRPSSHLAAGPTAPAPPLERKSARPRAAPHSRRNPACL